MAKTVDLRTYIALEKAFVRRLQRSWRIQSAPIYAKIAQACNDHQWDRARYYVTDLDMTEVGTHNREWIQYMLLSCAVFGANMVAKGKPSFVGVGTFDTFLKQVTNNFLMYLENAGTRRVQEEALQSIAEDEVQTKALKWDEAKHPRDKEGQFTETGGGTVAEVGGRGAGFEENLEGAGPERAEWVKRKRASIDADDVYTEAKDSHKSLEVRLRQKYQEQGLREAALVDRVQNDPEYVASDKKWEDAATIANEATRLLEEQTPLMRKEIVTNLAMSVAKDLGVPEHYIKVQDFEPRKFTVGGKEFTEAAHYEQMYEEILINSHDLDYLDAVSVKGVVAHEISHLMYDSLMAAAKSEKARHVRELLNPQGEPFAGMTEKYPASAVLATLADGQMFSTLSTKMAKENGHSAYAKSYWTDEAIKDRGHNSAINETMAEITRYITYPKSWYEKQEPSPNSPWVKLTKGMHEWYAARQARIAAMLAASKARK